MAFELWNLGQQWLAKKEAALGGNWEENEKLSGAKNLVISTQHGLHQWTFHAEPLVTWLRQDGITIWRLPHPALLLDHAFTGLVAR